MCVCKFISQWNSDLQEFNDHHIIRAQCEKPPEKRKSNRKIYLMNEYLSQNHKTHEFDADFKHTCVRVGEVGELVTWNVDDEVFIWNDDVISQASIVVDKAQRRSIQTNNDTLE